MLFPAELQRVEYLYHHYEVHYRQESNLHGGPPSYLLHRVVNGSRTQHRNPTGHGLEPCLPPHISAAHFVMVLEFNQLFQQPIL